MPAVITFPFLQSINFGVNMAFNSQLYATEGVYKRFAFEAPSTGAAEVYPRLDMLRGLREWLGDRVVQSLSQSSFTIRNRTFEQTIGVQREDFEDDKYGLLTQVAAEMGQNAARLPDLLTAQLLKLGTSTACYDGQNFFDLAHPNWDGLGNQITSPNYVSGGANAGPGWYLIDTTRVLKPVIFQNRRPFQLIPKFSMVDQQVFWNREFEWGVDGRCNVGFGIWQLAFYSTQPLNADTLTAARTAMSLYRRPDGAPMGIMPNMLMVPSALYPAAKALHDNEFQPIPAAAAVSLVPNTVRGMFAPLENPWLN